MFQTENPFHIINQDLYEKEKYALSLHLKLSVTITKFETKL